MKTTILLFAVTVALTASALDKVATRPARPTASAAGHSFNPQFSRDGERIVFVSHANNLVSNDDLAPWLDVFVYDRVTSNTVLVSANTTGTGGGNADANFASTSANGHFVAFSSRASNLVPNDYNSAVDVLLWDLSSGTTRLVSVDAAGEAPVGSDVSSIVPLSGYPQISANGRWVFFESRARNLVFGGTLDGQVSVFARDTLLNTTVLVSKNSTGTQAHGISSLQSITPDGRYAAFISTNLGGLNIRDRHTAQTVHHQSWTNVTRAVLSENGQHVVFVAGSPPELTLLRSDVASGVTLTVSDSVTNAENIAVSADGSVIYFEAFDPAGSHVCAWTAEHGTNVLAAGTLATASSDGRFALIRTVGVNGVNQLVHVSLTNGFAPDAPRTFTLVSATPEGNPSAHAHYFAVAGMTDDGAFVTFSSSAPDLVAADRNGASDIFLRDMVAGKTELISRAHSTRTLTTGLAHSFLHPNSISADGRLVVSLRYNDPSPEPPDTNRWKDVYLSDVVAGTTVPLTGTAAATANLVDGIPSEPFIDLANTNAYSQVVLSADGTTVAMVRRPSPTAEPLTFVMRAPDRNFSQARLMTVMPVRGMDFPALSSDGLLAAYQSVFPLPPGYGSSPGIFLAYFMEQPDGSYTRTNVVLSSPDGQQTGNGSSMGPRISADNAWVLFASQAGNLMPLEAGGANGPYPAHQIVAAHVGTNRSSPDFLQSIQKRLVSYNVSHQAVQGTIGGEVGSHTNINVVPVTTSTSNVVISANSRYAFYTLSDGSATYRHDLHGTRTNWVTSGEPGEYTPVVLPGAPNDLVCVNCDSVAVSGDGSVATYVRSGQVYARDFHGGAESLVSVNLGGGPGNRSSGAPMISGDGRYVVFQSQASDLMSVDNNNLSDVFLRDRLLGTTVLVSANALGQPGNGASSRPVLGPDGRTVAFQSFASDLVNGDYNDKQDIFLLSLGRPDSDNDGMDDDWEVAWFDDLSRDGTGDWDGDGASDRSEFLAGTNPKSSTSIFRVFTMRPAGGGATQVLWFGNPTRNYRVEYKDDLAAGWSVLAGTVSWNGSTGSVMDHAASSTGHRFYRVIRLP